MKLHDRLVQDSDWQADAPRAEGTTAFVMTDQSLSVPVGNAGSPTVMACLGLTGLRKVHCDPAKCPFKSSSWEARGDPAWLEDDTREPPASYAARPSHTGLDTAGDCGLTEEAKTIFSVYGFDLQPQQINSDWEERFWNDPLNTVHKRRDKAEMASNHHPTLKCKAKMRLKWF